MNLDQVILDMRRRAANAFVRSVVRDMKKDTKQKPKGKPSGKC